MISLRTDSIGDTFSSISESSDSNDLINPILDATNQHICGFDLTDVVLTGNNATVQGSDLFKVESTWKDKEALYKTVSFYLSKTGRQIAKNRDSFHCNRYGKPRVRKDKNGNPLHKKRDLSGGDLCIGCTWIIKFTGLIKTKDQNNKSRSSYGSDCPIRITSACCSHCTECEESIQSQEFVRSRSGLYVKSIDQEPLYDLCLYKMDHGRLSTSKVRETLLRVYADHKNVTPQHIFAVKSRVRRLVSNLKNDRWIFV